MSHDDRGDRAAPAEPSTGAPAAAGRERRTPALGDFLVEPTRDLADWEWLWRRDLEFPIESHRGLVGRLLVTFKRLFRPVVKAPQNDLWDRQRTFNLILLENLQKHLEVQRDTNQELRDRVAPLENLVSEGLTEIMRSTDALFARVDQKLDGYRRESRDLLGSLGAALAVAESAVHGEGAEGASPALDDVSRAREEHAYLELERRYRGTEEEIGERLARYLPWLERLAGGGRGEALDLGCGRGEALALLAARGIPARGVDGSARMVAHCRERGLSAEVGDLFEILAGEPAASLGAVLSFHVVEHLPPESLDRLVRLAYRALRPGGVLVLETPNPLSLVVAARNFWLDPTHRRPVHPQSLKLAFELAGFDPVEHLELRPFPEGERLPEIDLAEVPEAQRDLADRVNRLRDRIDELLFGFQDFALVGMKPPRS